MFNFSVFEQFTLVGSLYTLKPFVVSVVSIIGLVVLLSLVYSLDNLINVTYRWFFNSQYNMLSDMQLTIGQGYSKFICVLYLFIISLNLCGLLPFSYALTSQLAVTLFLGLGQWLGKLKVGQMYQGWKLFGHFLPIGLPLLLGPFFVLIEVIGYLVPLISISVRLFANVLSGHILVHVLFGFIWLGFIGGSGFFTWIPVVALLLLVGLEWAVAMIQGYVFVLLTTVYLGEVDILNE